MTNKFKILVICSLVILQIIFTVLMVKIENYIFDIIAYIVVSVVPFFILFLLFLVIYCFLKLIQFWAFIFFVYLITTIFIIYSNLFASTEINNIFGISSSVFPITTIILTFKYAFTLFFQTIYPIYLLWLVVFGVIIMILFIIKEIKLLIVLIIITIYLSAYIGVIIPMFKNQDNIIKEIAYKFDFYKNHNCSELYNVDSVVFLTNNKVLVRYIVPIEEKEFEIVECNLF